MLKTNKQCGQKNKLNLKRKRDYFSDPIDRYVLFDTFDTNFDVI